MFALRVRAHINKSIYEKFLLRIEKIIFSISDKFFPKLVYYYVFLQHTLVKSILKYFVINKS